MAMQIEAGSYTNLSASGIISKVPGSLLGFLVASTSTGVISFQDGTTTGATAITGSITPAAGAFIRLPAQCTTGCFMTLVSGSINITAIFQPG